ncbi:MAG: cell wall hydrolase [Eubacteriales bacterium]|nr:cell wall hydrolase [Bacillota bacterium]MBV1728059.1 cell wall hydrolase [Desulforudis sp.]MDP3050228.1 cell wall hydrolase [Eubacteriales bacterium]MDQ7788737.1 cell wall hydrolase [Clostridia bacterium]MBU4532497.1 cell wall hydrolase [Bacillota bacterium]
MAINFMWQNSTHRRIATACVAYLFAFSLTIGIAGYAAANERVVPVQTAAAVEEAVEADASRNESAASRGIKVNQDDKILLARVIEAEAATESQPGKVAVGAVILNRVEHKDFPNTVKGVVHQPKAFCTVSNGSIWRSVSTESMGAAEQAIAGQDPSGGALYFWNPYVKVNPWVWSRDIITQIDRHVFAH